MGESLATGAYGPLLHDLRAESAVDRTRAAEALVCLATDRLRYMAHRMLRRYPTVRRFLETDDIALGAALRLHRALGSVAPANPAAFLGLLALQVRRELIDLARKYAGPESIARHLDTDVITHPDGNAVSRCGEATDDVAAAEGESLARWERFHEVAATLPDDQRAVFEMVWYLGASQADCAHALGCSTRTVRRRWEAAREHFQQYFRGDVP